MLNVHWARKVAFGKVSVGQTMGRQTTNLIGILIAAFEMLRLLVLQPVFPATAAAAVGLQLRAGVAVHVQVRGQALRHRQQVQRTPLPEARH